MRYPEKLSPELTYELTRGAGTAGFVPAMEALLSYGFRDQLSRIEVPTLVVWGRNDMLVPRGDAREYVRLIGDNARREMFEDTGHLSMVERPSRFNRAAGGVRGRRAGARGGRRGRQRLGACRARTSTALGAVVRCRPARLLRAATNSEVALAPAQHESSATA